MDILGLGGGIFCIVGFLLVVACIVAANSIRIGPEYQRLVVFRLGRCVGARGP